MSANDSGHWRRDKQWALHAPQKGASVVGVLSFPAGVADDPGPDQRRPGSENSEYPSILVNMSCKAKKAQPNSDKGKPEKPGTDPLDRSRTRRTFKQKLINAPAVSQRIRPDDIFLLSLSLVDKRVQV